MANKPERIIIDTNIFISFLISNTFSKLDKHLRENRVVLLFSEELLDEFIEVTKRPKLKKYFTNQDITHLLEGLQQYAEFVNVKSTINVCRDPKDNFLLALAADGKANYLITGDNDLLSIGKFKKTKIIKISDYLTL